MTTDGDPVHPSGTGPGTGPPGQGGHDPSPCPRLLPAALRRMLWTLSLVSRIPVRIRGEPDFSGVPFWLPLIGLPAGAVAFAGYRMAGLAGLSEGVRAFVAILALHLAFDLFHLDGLVDTADALLGSGSRERRLEILRDPRAGTFGLFAAVAYLGALWHLSTRAALLPDAFAPLAFLSPVAGRTAAALIPVFLRPARPGGLGALLQPYSRRRAWSGAATAFAVCVAAGLVSDARAGTIALRFLLSVLAALVPVLRGYAGKIGGYTGDAMGAAVCLGTLAHLACVLAMHRLL